MPNRTWTLPLITPTLPDQNSASFFVNFGLPIFNRNQGEIARTGYALTQAQETAGVNQRHRAVRC